MNCPSKGKESAEILLDYCAQTLDPIRAAEFEKHIESCDECRRTVAAQHGLWQTLDQWKPAAVPGDFDARLFARIAREAEAPRWRQWWLSIVHPPVPIALWKPAVSLALAGAVLAVGLLVRMPHTGDRTAQMRADKVDIEQVEKTLEDLDILAPGS